MHFVSVPMCCNSWCDRKIPLHRYYTDKSCDNDNSDNDNKVSNNDEIDDVQR